MFFAKAIKIVLVSMSFMVVPAHAQELNDISTEVILLKDFNPFAVYGRTVKYYIAPGTRNVTFTINNDQSYRVDVGAAVEEAMKEWHQALGINFEPTLQNDAQLRVYMRAGSVGPINDDCGQTDTLALTSYSSPDQSSPTVTSISYFRSAIQSVLYDKSYRSKLKEGSDADVLHFLIKFISKHEMGHALGFMHPRTLYTQPVPACGRVFQSANVTSPYSTASIMTPELFTYLNYLYVPLRRPIVISDVDISPQERRAAARIASESCWPMSGRSISKLDSDAKSIRCESNSQIYPTLLFNGDGNDDDDD